MTPKIIIEVVKSFEENKCNTEFQFNNFIQSEYINKPLGAFIDDSVILKRKVKTYKDESGTVKYKVEFAKRAINSIGKKEDMSNDAWDLCEKIYEFIKKMNS